MSARPERDTPAWRFRAHAHDALRPPVRGARAGADRRRRRPGQLLDITAPGLLDPTTARRAGRPGPRAIRCTSRRWPTRSRPRRSARAPGRSPRDAPPLPPSLDALLVARMDRLDPDARALGQTAAVIGREFPARVLERVAGPRAVRGRPARPAPVRRRPRGAPVPRARVQLPPRPAPGGGPRHADPGPRGPLCARGWRRCSRSCSPTRSTSGWRCSPTTTPRAGTSRGRSSTSTARRDARRGVGPARRGRPAVASGPSGSPSGWTTRRRRAACGSGSARRPDERRAARQREHRPTPRAAGERRGPASAPTRSRASLRPPAPSRGRSTADDMPVALRLIGRSDGGDDEDWRRLRAAAAAAARVEDAASCPGLRGRRGRRLAVPRPRLVRRRLAGRSARGGPRAVRRARRCASSCGSRAGSMRCTARARPRRRAAGSVLFDGDGRALLVAGRRPSAETERRPRSAAGRRGADAGQRHLRAGGARPGTASPAERHGAGRPRLGDRHGARGGPGPRPQSAAMFAQMLRTAGRATPTGCSG